MRTIDIEDDVYGHIVRHTQEIGESASSILRRLLGIALSSHNTAITNDGEIKPDLDRELSNFLKSSQFLSLRTATKKLLGILGFAFKQKPDNVERVLEETPVGRTRVHFAYSREDIERSGKSTHPQNIPGTPYWVLTNSDTPQKRDLIAMTLKMLGYSAWVISEATKTLV